MSSTNHKTGESSCLATLTSNYAKLPDHLKRCFDYCCISIRYFMEKGKLVRLLLAEGLIQEKPGDIMEDIAANIIRELIALGMLHQERNGTELKVPSMYRQVSLIKSEKQDFLANAANSPLRVVIYDDGKDITSNFKSLIIRSLFVITAERCSSSFGATRTRGVSRASVETFCGLQFLLVLDLDGEVEYLPNEVGDLVHLRYLGLVNSELNELPQTLGNLQKLQTLDIRMCGKLHGLPIGVLSIQNLRHLLMSRCINDGEIRVPKGIGTLANLYTCTGVYAGDGIASELGTLTQLRELGVKRVSEEHASELYAAIMKMKNLISLSLEAETAYTDEDERLALFPEFELFSPPPLVQELCLDGGLVEMPVWLASMSNLTRLELYFSNLTEPPSTVLQFLPKLRHLSLHDAYRARCIDKEFCQEGGFPELQTLNITSTFLVDWTEIVNGAFPRLRSLSFNCSMLRFLPEGLQNISTLEELSLIPLHGDLARRLNSVENYKINHILKLEASFHYQRFPWIAYVGSPHAVLKQA
ncbi:hypothetical protein MANES_13G026200v8 [Manihot esculenta]|nr:hypothetical protein MANES_13G026200v8 [Manihot esculenta]